MDKVIFPAPKKTRKKKTSVPPFSKDTPNKVGDSINVSGKNTLTKTEDNVWHAAISDEPIDAKVDGKEMFCVRVENAGEDSMMMIGLTPMETFDSSKNAYFGGSDFTGCGLNFYDGSLWYPVDNNESIIDQGICEKATEIIIILTISNNGKKKEIRFLFDGKESKSFDVSEYLKEDLLFPTIILGNPKQQLTTIPIDQIKTRTPEIENLIKEYQQKNSGGAVASSSSSPAQLQKELDEALQKIAALSAELTKKDEEIAALKQQLESLKK
jgi:hypothetical protein